MVMGNPLKEKFIKYVYNGNSATLLVPSTWEISLHTGDPLDDDSAANELVGNGYTRMEFTPTIGGSPDFGMTNPADIEWAIATSDWTTVTHIVVKDKGNAGAMLDHGALTASQTVLTGNVFKVYSFLETMIRAYLKK